MRPGIPQDPPPASAGCPRFNEAQAMRPGIRHRKAPVLVVDTGFNEAQAMRPGIPPSTLRTFEVMPRASMRPRPCGPGYMVGIHSLPCGPRSFNEAQAMRPGIRAYRRERTGNGYPLQ